MKPTTRRNFINKTTIAGIGTLIALPAVGTILQSFNTLSNNRLYPTTVAICIQCS